MTAAIRSRTICLFVWCLRIKTQKYTELHICLVLVTHLVCLTLQDGQTDKLTVCDKKALRKIFGTKKDKVTRDRTQLRGEGFSELFSSSNAIRAITQRKVILAGHAARVGYKRNAYGILVGKP